MKTFFWIVSILLISQASHAGVIYGVDRIRTQANQTRYPAFVQIASFKKKDHADQFRKKFSQHTQIPIVIRSSTDRHRVLLGPFPNQTTLLAFANKKEPTPSIKKPHPTNKLRISTHRMPSSPRYAAKISVLHPNTIESKFHIHPGSHPELSGYLGASYIPNSIKGQTLQLLPYEIGPYADTFSHQKGGASFTWGLDAKYRFMLHNPSVKSPFFDSIGAGIDFFQITNANQTGQVLQFNLPEFENYNYTLGLSNIRLMADIDMTFRAIKYNLIPFIEGGLGGSMTTVSYQSTGIPPIDSPQFRLSDESTWGFAYQVGGGLKYRLKSNAWLSLRYLYANMGEASSSLVGSSTNLATPLNVNMSTQNLLLGLTYSLE